MHLKKFAITGAIILVVLGCVLAAGCTSTSIQSQTESTDPIVGFWNATDIGIENGTTVNISSEFFDDGTGAYMLFNGNTFYREDTVKWKNLGNNTYQIEITNPDGKSHTVTYTLSADKKTMGDNSGETWVRLPEPAPLEKNDKIIGTWYATSEKDGQKIDNIFIFHDDGIGYWMKVADTPSISLKTMRQQNIRKIGENTYIARCSAGRVYQIEYKPETDSFLVDNKSEFKRLDPIVGIWTGNSNKGGDVVTTTFKRDGTGITVTSYPDGTAKVYKMTNWKKNDNGSYDVLFNDGYTETYTLGSDKKSVTTTTGINKTKQFTDSYLLLPITGVWASEKGGVVIINGDKTGTYRTSDNHFLPFTWNFNWNQTDKINFTITYKSGIAKDGTSLAEKTFNWTYDLNSNKLINSNGTEFTHPEKSVEGKYTLN